MYKTPTPDSINRHLRIFHLAHATAHAFLEFSELYSELVTACKDDPDVHHHLYPPLTHMRAVLETFVGLLDDHDLDRANAALSTAILSPTPPKTGVEPAPALLTNDVLRPARASLPHATKKGSPQ